ncbi:hypothetical protein NFI96_015139 [Prochilodus magdalenae]|nr:hypothetical protein NFI96_015139 [Prochilodus magdalenae]
MALCEEKFLSTRSACTTQGIAGADPLGKVQENSSEVQPKVNRLKRQKRSAGKEPPAVIRTGGDGLSLNSNTCSKATATSTKDVKQSSLCPLKEGGGQCPPPKLGLLPLKRSLKQSRLNLKVIEPSRDEALGTSAADPETDIIDLCEDEETREHVSVTRSGRVTGQRGWDDPPQDSVTQVIRTRRDDGDVQPLVPMGGIQKASRSHGCCSKSERSRRDTASVSTAGRREGFSVKTCEALLELIQNQNQRFPVHLFFTLLLELRNQSEKPLASHGTETSASCPDPGSEKRKQDPEFLHDVQVPKRQRPRPDRPHVEPAGRSRLSVSRRRKQQDTPPPAPSACSAGEARPQECEVLWTDKYQPQHSEGVIGNSGAVRKLCSWLKEWRMRADVEERRKRREERRRMQEEGRESWDCGDFEGELVLADREAELCNTVLIQGPTGVGKTAAVYACAEELGYKVFEVNSSSLRSGQTVLSQLREATQSHQVGALRSDATRPRNSHSTDPPAASTGASREDASRRPLTSRRKTPSRKKRAAPPAVTLKHFFQRTDRPVDRSTGPPPDLAAGSSEAGPDVLNEPDAKTSTEEDVLSAEAHRTPPISLILFEEVDVIFSEDVGFLAAIKTLMTTTKRPIILTTNDPLFSQSFKGRFEEIRFKAPPVGTIRSYLQCLGMVEGVRLDPADLSVVLAECEADVRRSVLELELWMRSGGGRTLRHVQNMALMCRSWAELESTGRSDVLVEIRRMGHALFYSNLDLLFAPLSKTPRNMKEDTFKSDKKNSEASSSLNETRAVKLSRLKVRKHGATGAEQSRSCSKHGHPSASPVKGEGQSGRFSAGAGSSELGCCCLDSLACFFDTMSFLDSWIYKRPLQVPGPCQDGPQGWMGATLTDSLVDQLRKEAVDPHLERSYEFLAVSESLGFHQCRAELSERWRKAEQLKEVMEGERFAQLMEHLVLPESSEAPVSMQSKPSVVQKSREVINKVLASKAFRYHGNKKAIAMDYLPTLRSISRMEKQHSRHR